MGGWLNEAGMAFYWGGRYREAEPLLQQALALRQQVLAKWDEDLAHSLAALACKQCTLNNDCSSVQTCLLQKPARAARAWNSLMVNL